MNRNYPLHEVRRFFVLACCAFCATTAVAERVDVANPTALIAALANAQPGDEIVLADGTYAINANLQCNADGTQDNPIVVRAASPLGAHLEMNALEGFKVSGPFWTFADLDIQGVCASDPDCEHAFHVTGRATDFVLRNSRIRDFNAQLKVNAVPNGNGGNDIPHRGLIEHNDIGDTRPRNTSSPVTKLNIDTGDDWVVRDNTIHDFFKAGGNFVSYGAFMKSGGQRGVFERNRVLCSRDVVPPNGAATLGLSFGGGGTGAQFCAPAFDANVPCDVEHTGGILRNNIIAACSDVGIYLNRAAHTRVLFNTLVGTSGVDFRFDTTTGEAHGNVLTSVLRERNGGTFSLGTNSAGTPTAGTNLENVAVSEFQQWYAAPLEGDLTLIGDVSSLLNAGLVDDDVVDDFCGRSRPSSAPTLGALEHSLGDCSQNPTTEEPQQDAGPVTIAPIDGGQNTEPSDAGTGASASDAGALAAGDAGNGASLIGGGQAFLEPASGCGSCAAVDGQSTALFLGLLVLLRRRSSQRPKPRRNVGGCGMKCSKHKHAKALWAKHQ